jgi:hypothetical protein
VSMLVGMADQKRREMKHVLPAVVASLLLTTPVSAEEAALQTVKADNVTEDCSRQVWPSFRRRASVTETEQSEASLHSLGSVGTARYRTNRTRSNPPAAADKSLSTAGAVVEELAGVRWHRLGSWRWQ